MRLAPALAGREVRMLVSGTLQQLGPGGAGRVRKVRAQPAQVSLLAAAREEPQRRHPRRIHHPEHRGRANCGRGGASGPTLCAARAGATPPSPPAPIELGASKRRLGKARHGGGGGGGAGRRRRRGPQAAWGRRGHLGVGLLVGEEEGGEGGGCEAPPASRCPTTWRRRGPLLAPGGMASPRGLRRSR
eukprot:scaffold934_cov271-Prasinococcus_capsulatus_cf.AAC.3